jgi:hypothetical protein
MKNSDKKVLMLLSASVERFCVSRMRDFKKAFISYLVLDRDLICGQKAEGCTAIPHVILFFKPIIGSKVT